VHEHAHGGGPLADHREEVREHEPLQPWIAHLVTDRRPPGASRTVVITTGRPVAASQLGDRGRLIWAG